MSETPCRSIHRLKLQLLPEFSVAGALISQLLAQLTYLTQESVRDRLDRLQVMVAKVGGGKQAVVELLQLRATAF